MNTDFVFRFLLAFATLEVIGLIVVYYVFKREWEYIYNQWSQQCRISNLLEMQCRRNVSTCKQFCLRSDLDNCDYYLDIKQMVNLESVKGPLNKCVKKSFDIFKGGA